VIFVGLLEREGLVDDCAGGEEVERHCEEERDDHEALSDRHAGGRNRCHYQSVYGSQAFVGLEQKIAAHADEGVSDDFGDVDAVEDFGQSAFGGVFEVEDQREDQLMVHVAEDNGCESLDLLRKGFVSIEIGPLEVRPLDARDAIIDQFPLSPIVVLIISGETEEEGDGDDGDIDDD